MTTAIEAVQEGQSISQAARDHVVQSGQTSLCFHPPSETTKTTPSASTSFLSLLRCQLLPEERESRRKGQYSKGEATCNCWSKERS